MGSRAHVARFTSKKRELMRAVLRLIAAVLAVGLALAPAPLLAQDAATTAEPPGDVVGPRDLQNFSLNGTVTRPADTVAAPRSTAPAATTRRPVPAGDREAAATTTAQPIPAPSRSESGRASSQTARAAPEPPVPATPASKSAGRSASSVTLALPPLASSSATNPSTTTPSPGFASEPDTLAGEHRPLLWPWLLAALALGAGGAFLFLRHRSRESFAGGPQVDAFLAPEPVSTPPLPAPAPPKTPPAMPSGIVSTRLRPWIEVVFEPQRFVVDEQQVAIEFEIRLQNSGNAPARGVLVEASLFNAGPDQDREIGAFFQSPVGEGERIAVINPLKTVAMHTRVAVPRDSVRLYEVGGRQVVVPLIAFNALYSWSGGEGQTSNRFLLGRDTKAEKMAPFRLDLGPRVFRGVGAHALPEGVRV
jgi:hypothetical protein